MVVLRSASDHRATPDTWLWANATRLALQPNAASSTFRVVICTASVIAPAGEHGGGQGWKISTL